MAFKILVVEDQKIVAIDLKTSLQSLGYHVPALATSGEEAIRKAEEIRPDLVLMDIQLEGDMDGIAAAEYIYNRLNIPVIYLTAHSDTNTLRRAVKVGPFGYILKPFDEQDLITSIETAFRRYQLEQKVKESERWWATTLKSVGDGVIATDATGNIKFLNPVAEALTGWKHEDAVGLDVTEVLDLINSQTRATSKNPIDRAIREGDVVFLESDVLLISKHQIEIPIDDSAAPIKDDEGNVTGAVLVFRDITERKQIEESRLVLEQAKLLEMQMLEFQKIIQLKEDFLSTISHELRTPIANIRMATKMLGITLNKVLTFLTESALMIVEREKLAQYLQILDDQSQRESNLIDNLLDLQMLDSSNRSSTVETIQLQTWLPKMLLPFQQRTQNQQQELQLRIDSALPPLVCDRFSLERILSELLHNACKYTPAAEQIIVTAIALSNMIQFQVCNSGIEIPQSELCHIFDKFYRVPQQDPWQQGGTGLGLALVQKLVEQMLGTIQVESTGGWTTFTVQLPLQYQA